MFREGYFYMLSVWISCRSPSPSLFLWGFRSRKMSVDVRINALFSRSLSNRWWYYPKNNSICSWYLYEVARARQETKVFSLAFLLPRRWWNKDVIGPGIPFVNSYNNFSANARVSLYFRKPVNYYFLTELFFSLVEFLLIYLSGWGFLVLLSIKLCILSQSNSVLSIIDERELSGCRLCTNQSANQCMKEKKARKKNLRICLYYLIRYRIYR